MFMLLPSTIKIKLEWKDKIHWIGMGMKIHWIYLWMEDGGSGKLVEEWMKFISWMEQATSAGAPTKSTLFSISSLRGEEIERKVSWFACCPIYQSNNSINSLAQREKNWLELFVGLAAGLLAPWCGVSFIQSIAQFIQSNK